MPYSDFEIINDNEEEIKAFHKKGWGHHEVSITMKDIEALLEGKCLGYFDTEYTHVLKLNVKEK